MPKHKVALLIEWNVYTGKRAGNIDPNDPGLQCYGWQTWDQEPALELRLIEDDRDISQYENIKGVTIIRGIEAINKCIADNFPPRYKGMSCCVLDQNGQPRNAKIIK